MLQGNGSRLQIYVRKDAVGDQAFELYKLLDLGDPVEYLEIPTLRHNAWDAAYRSRAEFATYSN